MIANAWTGPGEDLRGYESGWLTVEAAAPSDGPHLRAICRCRCGRIAFRRIAALRAGEARACAHCVSEEREERARLEAERTADAPVRHRQSPEEVAHEAKLEGINARRRARYVPRAVERGPCVVADCEAPIGRGRVRYCDEHGAAARRAHSALESPPRRRPRAGDPEWDAIRERSKRRRRVKRANDRAFRATEARLAREYRERQRAKVQEGEA